MQIARSTSVAKTVTETTPDVGIKADDSEKGTPKSTEKGTSLAEETKPKPSVTPTKEIKEKSNVKKRSSKVLRPCHSFKVLQECPLMMMILFQLYPKYLQDNIKTLIPLMMKALKARNLIPESAKSMLDRNAPGEILEEYHDLIACQIKTLSFLTYMVRGMSLTDVMKRYEKELAADVVSLLRSCPYELIKKRKEIFVATRHILSSDFRSAFFLHLDFFLDESVLVGNSTSYKPIQQVTSGSPTKRKVIETRGSDTEAQPAVPLSEIETVSVAYTALAELVQCSREKLNLAQVSKVISIFSRSILDESLPVSIQTMCVRSLLSLVDNIINNDEPEPTGGRTMLLRIFRTLVSKVHILRVRIPAILRKEQEKHALAKEANTETIESFSHYYFLRQPKPPSAAVVNNSPQKPSSESSNTPKPSLSSVNSKDTSLPEASVHRIDVSSDDRTGRKHCWEILNIGIENENDSIPDSLSEMKVFFQTIMVGLKTVLWCICNYGKKRMKRQDKPKQPKKGKERQMPKTVVGLLSKSEMLLVSNLLQWGLQCLVMYRECYLPDSDVPSQTRNGKETNLAQNRIEKSKSSSGRLLSSAKLRGKVPAEEPEAFQIFASVFAVLDPLDFMDLFSSNFDLVFANMVRHPPVLAFAKAFMGNQSVSRYFVLVTIQFVLRNIYRVSGDKDTVKNRYFKPVMMPVTESHMDLEETKDKEYIRNVPLPGVLGGLGLQHLGCDDLLLTPKGARPQSQMKDVNTGIFNHEERFHRNEAAVLAQLCDSMFASLAAFPDDPVNAIQVPESPKAESEEKSGESRGKENTACWGISRVLRDSFEMLLVCCVTLAAEMTTSPQRILRHSMETKGNTDLGVLRSTHLGRDCYLLILRGMLGVIARRPKLKSLFPERLEKVIPATLSALSKLLVQAGGRHRASGHARSDLIAEVSLLITSRIPGYELSKYLSILQRPMETGILAMKHGNVELTRLALRVLESWVDSQGPDEIEVFLLKKNQTSGQRGYSFGHLIARLLEPAPSPFGTAVLRILGKLGPRIRKSILTSPRNLPTKPDYGLRHGLVIESLWKQSGTKKLSIPVDELVKETYSFLCDLYRPNEELLLNKPISSFLSGAKGLENPTNVPSHDGVENFGKKETVPFEKAIGGIKNYGHYKDQGVEFLTSCIALVLNKVSAPASAESLDLELRIQRDELVSFLSKKVCFQ